MGQQISLIKQHIELNFSLKYLGVTLIAILISKISFYKKSISQYHTFTEHLNWIFKGSFGLNNDFASCGKDGKVIYYNMSTQKVANLRGHDGSVYALCFSKINKCVITGGKDKSINIQNIQQIDQNITEVQTISNAHDDAVTTLSLNDKETYLISGGLDKKIKIWDLQSLNCVSCLDVQMVLRIQFFDENKFVSVCGDFTKDDRILSCWIIPYQDPKNTYELIKIKDIHNVSLSDIISTNKQNAIIAGPCRDVTFFDLNTMKLTKSVKNAHLQEVSSVLLIDQQYFVTADCIGELKIWKIVDETFKQLYKVCAHLNKINSLSYCYDKKQLLSGSKDHTLKLWDLDKYI